MEVKLHYYSERGMVDSLLHVISSSTNNCRELLKTIYDVDGNQVLKSKIDWIKKVDIFNEFSLGKHGFGEPDLIIKVSYDNGLKPNLLFVEAKIASFSSSVNSKMIENCYKKHTSDINIQLRLKNRFVKAYFSREKSVEIIDNGNDNNMDFKDTRKLKKKDLVNYLDEFVFKGIDKDNYSRQIYYVALTKDGNDNPFKKPKRTKKECKEIVDYLPFKKDSEEYKHLAYFNYYEINKLLNIEENKKYNEMFNGSLNLEKNKY